MKRGSVVLTPFPFTDLTGRKVRPALVVSRSGRTGSDVILAFITSYRGTIRHDTELVVSSSHPEFLTTGLKGDSVIKLDKLVTIEASIVLGELGELPASLLDQASERLRFAMDL